MRINILMETVLILFAITLSNAISISPNGNTPDRKMLSVSKKSIEVGGFIPIIPVQSQQTTTNYQKDKNYFHDKYYSSGKKTLNGTKLPINERYRRLIPYMTFYLANDFNLPHDDNSFSSNTPIQKSPNQFNNIQPQSQTSELIGSKYIPRYQGNRLSQFNIASAFPNKVIQNHIPTQQESLKYSVSQNPLIGENKYSPVQSVMRPPSKQAPKNYYTFSQPISVPVKVNLQSTYNVRDMPNIQYYSNPRDEQPQQQYKLVPYEQTPPVNVPSVNMDEDYFVPKVYSFNKPSIPVPVASPSPSVNTKKQNYQNEPSTREQFYLQSEPKHPNEIYQYLPTAQADDYYVRNNQQNTEYQPTKTFVYKNTNDNNQQTGYQPTKTFVFKNPEFNQSPTTESGFKPMLNLPQSSKSEYATPAPYNPYENLYYTTKEQYVVTTQKPQVRYNTRPTKRPVVYTPSTDYVDNTASLNYGPSSSDQYEQNNLAKILKSLQNSHSLPEKITTDNIDSSIKTLVHILSNLKGSENVIELSTPKPIITSTPVYYKTTLKPLTNGHSIASPNRYRPRVKTVSLTKPAVTPLPIHEYPPQDISIEDESDQSESYPSENNELGGTPGRPGIDYPALDKIPVTSFDCKTQRYKGFFGDPDTSCQVWHYCDLNGGQASFLCPNGTIFSQVALTCDWWFNVKCSTTTQLYVLNERLYKYILPYSPKFPEDYSGPLVDKYLTIKYKEMEEKMKKKKKVLKPEVEMETEKADVIEIKTSGMSGALRPYDN